MIVLYKTTLLDPQGREGWYYGIHQTVLSDRESPLWSKECPTGYIGSGGLFQTNDGGTIKTLKRGWIHINTELLKELDSYSLGEERKLILNSWKTYGIHPQVLAWGKAHHIVLPYREGLVLNCQATSAENLWPTDGSVPPCNTEVALKKKSDSIRKRYEESPEYRERLSRGIKTAYEEDPTISLRGLATKRDKYGKIPGVAEMIEAARSKESRSKAGRSRSASAIQWISPDFPDIEHTSLLQLCTKIKLIPAYSWYTKYGCSASKFTYKNITFLMINSNE